MAGEENELKEVITNDKFLPIPMLHVKFDTPKSFVFENECNSSISDNYYRDDVFTVMGHQSVTRTLKFTCAKRGCFYMHDTNITSSDLFMKLTLTGKCTNHAVINVFPRKVDLAFFDIPFKTITGNFVTQKLNGYDVSYLAVKYLIEMLSKEKFSMLIRDSKAIKQMRGDSLAASKNLF